jgi:hypothetical protein
MSSSFIRIPHLTVSSGADIENQGDTGKMEMEKLEKRLPEIHTYRVVALRAETRRAASIQ